MPRGHLLPRHQGEVPGRAVLYCTVLYCTVLYCTLLYCTVLYCRYQAELEAWAGEAGWHSRDRGHSLVLAASSLSFRSKRSVSAAADCRAVK